MSCMAKYGLITGKLYGKELCGAHRANPDDVEAGRSTQLERTAYIKWAVRNPFAVHSGEN